MGKEGGGGFGAAIYLSVLGGEGGEREREREPGGGIFFPDKLHLPP